MIQKHKWNSKEENEQNCQQSISPHPPILKTPKPSQIGFSYLSVSLDSNFGTTQILACSFYVITSASEMACEHFVMRPNLFQKSPRGLFFIKDIGKCGLLLESDTITRAWCAPFLNS